MIRVAAARDARLRRVHEVQCPRPSFCPYSFIKFANLAHQFSCILCDADLSEAID